MEHECKCNSSNTEEQVLDVLSLPRQVRHPAILGALESLPTGGTLLLMAPHMPSPLLAEVESLAGSFTHEVVVDGPDEWQVRLRRQS